MLLGLLAFGAGGANYAYGASQSESPVSTTPAQADAVIDVPWHWQLAPEGLRATGGQFRLIFLTDTGLAPDSTDIGDYNDFVQEQARASELEALGAYHSGFRVVGSTAAVGARDNTEATFTDDDKGVPIYWLLGSRVADNYKDFWDGTWANDNDPRDRAGQFVPRPELSPLRIFTGSNSNGTKSSDNPFGAEFVSAGYLHRGSLTSVSPTGTHGGVTGGTLSLTNSLTTHRYYALSPVFRASARPEPELSETTEVRPDWTLTPDGLRAGDRFRLLFVTSTGADGRNKGREYYTGFVQERAAAGHTDLRFHAPGFRPVVSVRLEDGSDANARDITGTNFTDADPGVPIYWLNGAKVADDYADFYDGDWDEEAQGRDETGAAVAFSEVTGLPIREGFIWTGSNHDGTAGVEVDYADDGSVEFTRIFTLGTKTSGIAGRPNNTATGRGPLQGYSLGFGENANPHPIYAMSQVFVVTPEPGPVRPRSVLAPDELAPGTKFRVMFAARYWGSEASQRFCPEDPDTPECGIHRDSGNIHAYNRFVQDMARAAGASGIPIKSKRRAPLFRALVSTAGTDARDNTGTVFTYSDDSDDTNDDLGVPIYWLNGAKVADNYRDLYDGSWDNPTEVRDPLGEVVNLGTGEFVEEDCDPVEEECVPADGVAATGSRSDGTYDPLGFMGHPNYVVRTGSRDGPLHGGELINVRPPEDHSESVIDVGIFYVYGLSPIFEVAAPRAHVEVAGFEFGEGYATVEWTADEHEDFPLTNLALQAREISIQRGMLTTPFSVNPSTVTGETGDCQRAASSRGHYTYVYSCQYKWEGLQTNTWHAVNVLGEWNGGSIDSGWVYFRTGSNFVFPPLEQAALAASSLATAELPQTKPGGVRGLSASAGETGVALSWREPEDNGDGHPIFYRIERALTPDQWEELEPGTLETTWTDLSPPESGNVFYRVAAYNAAGAGPWLGAALQLAADDPNTPATGQPTISGTVQVGETLTADTRGISDDDGLDNVSFTYQWLASDTDILDATSSTYTLADADEGKAVKVKVSFEDDAGNGETLTSAATAAVAAAPAATPLTASHEDAPASHDGQDSFTFKLRFSEEVALSYLSLRDHAFTVTGGSVTKAQRLTQESNTGWTITATPGSDADVTLVLPETTDCAASGAVCTAGGKQLSAALTLTVPGPEPPPQQNIPATGAPTIGGTARVDETLTVSTSGIADADGLVNVSYSYQWQADDSDIAGATAATYTLADADLGKTVRVRVNFSDDADNEETLTSAATPTVAPRPNTPATGAPAISGTARVDQTLTASTSGIADADGLVNVSYSYQWLADDADLPDATGSAYVLTEAEQGKAIKVRVSFHDNAGNEETLTSAATSAVAARPNTPATGAPTIGGTAQVDETLTASTSDIADEDGLVNVSYSYQWLADDSDIAGATSSTYALSAAKQGKTIRVRVSFDDDDGNEETLTSVATAEVVAAPSPLTARFEGQPSSHDGQTAFTFELHFSEEFGVSYATLRDHAFSVTGGTVSKAQRLTQGSNQGWRITVTPGSDADVTVVLPETTDCDAQGAICAGDGRMLSNRNEFTVSGS